MSAEHRTAAALSSDEFEARLRGSGLGVRVGPFDFNIRARVDGLYGPLHTLYAHCPVLAPGGLRSAHVNLRRATAIPFGSQPKIRFDVDGHVPHGDLPAGQALAVLEWGINLVIALRFQCFLLLHSAVLERNGRALLLPAAPGHGKTTLCAALAHRGWRLLSDEFGLIRPVSSQLVPIPRPMPLKNESIAVMRDFAPDAVLGPDIPGTRKGTVAHVRPPAESVARSAETAPAGWVVFPRWAAGVTLALRELPKAEAFMRLATNAFNYDKHGEAGFESLRLVIDGSRCFSLAYSNLAEAVETLTRLADDDAG